MSFVTSPFSYCRYTNIIILNSPNIEINANWLFAKMQSKTLKVEFKHPECISSLDNTFYECEYMQSIDISNLNTSNVKSMNRTFSRCSSLISLDLSNFDTSNVESMKGMFDGCNNLIVNKLKQAIFIQIRDESKRAD